MLGAGAKCWCLELVNGEANGADNCQEFKE